MMLCLLFLYISWRLVQIIHHLCEQLHHWRLLSCAVKRGIPALTDIGPLSCRLEVQHSSHRESRGQNGSMVDENHFQIRIDSNRFEGVEDTERQRMVEQVQQAVMSCLCHFTVICCCKGDICCVHQPLFIAFVPDAAFSCNTASASVLASVTLLTVEVCETSSDCVYCSC